MMMFKTVLVALAATLLGSVSALPFQKDTRGVRVVGISMRSIEPEFVPEILVRGEHIIEVEKRQNIPAEVPVKSGPGGQIIPYKRDVQIAEEILERDEEDLVEFEKRQEIYPEELPTKSNNGDIEPYKRDEEEVPFHKRVIPSEIAVRTNERGEIVPY